MRSTNTDVIVTFGNLFDFSGHKAIGVNDFFDSEVGKHISPNSLHGQFILRYFSGRKKSFDTQIDKSLKRIAAKAAY